MAQPLQASCQSARVPLSVGGSTAPNQRAMSDTQRYPMLQQWTISGCFGNSQHGCVYLLPIQERLVEAQARCRAVTHYNLPVNCHVCSKTLALAQDDTFYEGLPELVPKQEGPRRRRRRQRLLRWCWWYELLQCHGYAYSQGHCLCFFQPDSRRLS